MNSRCIAFVLSAFTSLALCGCAGSSDKVLDTFTPPAAAAVAAPAKLVVAAVGDIDQEGKASRQSAPGRVAASIAAAGPDLVFGLGDYQSPVATCASMLAGFDQLWAALLPLTFHIGGSGHDWTTSTRDRGYRRYFSGTCPGQTSGASALNRGLGGSIGPGDFWSQDIGSWHLVGLPTEMWRRDPARARLITGLLSRDLALAKARGQHLLVAYYDSYFTSATRRPSTNGPVQKDKADRPGSTLASRRVLLKPWIDALDRYDVRVTLSAGRGNYERSCPVLSTGACTPDAGDGTTSFNVSTGGGQLRSFRGAAPSYIERRFADTHGWLALSLDPDGSFSWQFHAVDGHEVDMGSRAAPHSAKPR